MENPQHTPPPPWLGAGAELVLGYVTRPAELLDPVRGRPPVGLTIWTVVTLGLCGGNALALVGVYNKYVSTELGVLGETEIFNEKIFIAVGLVLASMSAVLFSFWYRAMLRGARAVASLSPVYSTSYALTTLWVPVANLFCPIQTFSHLWLALSSRRKSASNGLAILFVLLWWGVFWFAFIDGRVAAWRSHKADEDTFVATVMVLRQSQYLYAISCGLTMLVVLLFAWRLAAACKRAMVDPTQRQALPVERSRNYSIAMASAIGYLVLFVIAAIFKKSPKTDFSFLNIVMYSVAMAGLGEVRGLWRKTRTIPASMRMYRDRRPPILLLRAFRSDGLYYIDKSPLEEVIESVAHDYGPVVALGQPGESISPTGAGRLYLPQCDWQAIAGALIQGAHFIFIICAAGEGLRWELMQICERGRFDNIVFVPVGQQKQWDEFVKICPPILAHSLSQVSNISNVLYVMLTAERSLRLFVGAKSIGDHGKQLKAIFTGPAVLPMGSSPGDLRIARR